MTEIVIPNNSEFVQKVEEMFPNATKGDEERYNCAMYIALRDPIFTGKAMPHGEVARYMGVHRNTLYRWVNGWRRTGMMAEVKTILLDILHEEIDIAQMEVLAQVPAIYQSMLEIALEGKSDRNRLEAMKLLHEYVIVPARSTVDETDDRESKYIQSIAGGRGKFNPADV
jgi:transposase-like protein